jgi:hypothetical protein
MTLVDWEMNVIVVKKDVKMWYQHSMVLMVKHVPTTRQTKVKDASWKRRKRLVRDEKKKKKQMMMMEQMVRTQ